MPTQQEAPNPKTSTADYKSMQPVWQMIAAILAGPEAMRAPSTAWDSGTVPGPAIPYANLSQLGTRRSGKNSGNQSPYLPQLPNESNADYELRRANAPLTNIYKDVAENLSGKPFAKTCELSADAPSDLKEWQNNVDGQGNSLHVFASSTFYNGINKGIDWIFIDYIKADNIKTLADERALGAKPYWVHVRAENMLAVYSVFFAGREVLTHARIYETTSVRDGFSENLVERVRELNRDPLLGANGQVTGFGPATWKLWELQQDVDNKSKKQWIVVDSGTFSIGVLPLVAFKTGDRDGCSWRVTPPLQDLAYMQIEEFQQESNKREIKIYAAFPMLSGDGVARPTDTKGAPVTVSVGPKTVLFTGTHGDSATRPGSFRYVEPAGTSLNFLKQDLEGFRQEMRDLGKQPLAAANLTVVTTANISMQASSKVQAWTLLLKDALEQAMIVTSLWLGRANEKTEVEVYKDFGIDMEKGTEPDQLLKAEAQGVFSKETVAEEFKRRGLVSDTWDPEEEKKRLADQSAKLLAETPIDPRTGKPLKPVANAAPNFGRPAAPPKPATALN